MDEAEKRRIDLAMQLFYARHPVSMRVPEHYVEDWTGADLNAFLTRHKYFAERKKEKKGRTEIVLNNYSFKPNSPAFWALACQDDFDTLIVLDVKAHSDSLCELFDLPKVFVRRLRFCDDETAADDMNKVLDAASRVGTVSELEIHFAPYMSSQALFSAIFPHISTKFETVIFSGMDFFGVDMQAFFDSRSTMSKFSLLFEDCDLYADQEAQLASLLLKTGNKFRAFQPPNFPNEFLFSAMERSQISKLIYDEGLHNLALHKYRNLIELDLTKADVWCDIEALPIAKSTSVRTLRLPEWMSSYRDLHNFLKVLEFNNSVIDIHVPKFYSNTKDDDYWEQLMLHVLADTPVVERIHFGRSWELCHGYAHMCRFKFELTTDNVLARLFHPTQDVWVIDYMDGNKTMRKHNLFVKPQMNMYQWFAQLARTMFMWHDGVPCSVSGLRLIINSSTVLDPIWTPRHLMLKKSWKYRPGPYASFRVVRGYQLAVLAFCREALSFDSSTDDYESAESSRPTSRRRLTESTDQAVTVQRRVTLGDLPPEILKIIVANNESSYMI